MKFHPGLRHNKHMVRMVKTGDKRNSYQLGNAYGNEFVPVDATERRRRILDQWGIPSQSPRRPESPAEGEILSRRSQRIHFHQLDGEDQELLTTRQHSAPLTRRDVRPGTKARIHLGHDRARLTVLSYPTMNTHDFKAFED